METKICDRCGKELSGSDEGHCSACKADLIHRKRHVRLFFGVIVVGLLLAGLGISHGQRPAWDSFLDELLGRPAAVVNGERIMRSAVMERVKVSKRMLERQYGMDRFAGERGRKLLEELEQDILRKAVEERLIAQEARRMNIVVTQDRVRQELQKVVSEIYGTWESFRARLSEDGVSEEYLANHIRNLLLLEELKKAKTPPGGEVDGAFAFGTWLVKARQDATITVDKSIVSLPLPSSGGCPCCSKGGSQQSSIGPLDPEMEDKAMTAALAAYQKTNPPEMDVKARVTDRGCHIQVDIEKEGKVIKSYAYQDGEVFDN